VKFEGNLKTLFADVYFDWFIIPTVCTRDSSV